MGAGRLSERGNNRLNHPSGCTGTPLGVKSWSMSSPSSDRPVTVALVDDYDVVLKGLAHLFDEYQDRVVIAEIDANAAVNDNVDVVLYDSFAQPESDHDQIAELIKNPRARHVVVYTWNLHTELIDAARRQAYTDTSRRR